MCAPVLALMPMPVLAYVVQSLSVLPLPSSKPLAVLRLAQHPVKTPWMLAMKPCEALYWAVQSEALQAAPR
jgi:hypothetical protein